MISPKESYDIYRHNWAGDNAPEVFTRLLEDIRRALEVNHADPALMNNYGAILLDLNRNKEALDWLSSHPLDFSEYYENLAIAVIKCDRSEIDKCRELNGKAGRLSKKQYAIAAYIDYQGL
jgi:5,10-methenyltetrahydromethanopterin hydrogenase